MSLHVTSGRGLYALRSGLLTRIDAGGAAPTANTLTLGATWTQSNKPDSNAQRFVVRNTVQVQNVHINAFGSGIGSNEPVGDIDYANYDWGPFDLRVNYMQQAQSPNGTLCITLYAPPQWMIGQIPNTWDIYDSPVLPEYVDEWAALCAFIAARYPDVTHFQVWNELKGYWNASLNRWDYEAYTTMYNAVYTALKAARPDALVGGPYPSFAAWTPGSGRPVNSNATLDLGGVSSSITGSNYIIDARTLDAVNYWRLNNVGYDFVCWDTGLTIDGQAYEVAHTAANYATVDRYAKLTNWFAARFPGKPIWVSEYYYGGGSSPLVSVINQLESTNQDVVALLWHEKNGVTDLLYDTAGVQTPVGDVHASHKIGTAATVTESNWVGTNATAWPSPWVTAGGIASSITITGNEGQMATPVATTTLGRWSQSMTDAFLSVQVRFGDVLITRSISVRWNEAAQTGYDVDLITTTNTLRLYRVVSGVRTSVASGAITFASGVNYLVQIQYFGKTIKARVFDPANNLGSAAWTLTYTDNTPLASGDVRLRAINDSAAIRYSIWDNAYLMGL